MGGNGGVIGCVMEERVTWYNLALPSSVVGSGIPGTPYLAWRHGGVMGSGLPGLAWAR